jgi:hypothetical protein
MVWCADRSRLPPKVEHSSAKNQPKRWKCRPFVATN